MKYRQAVRRFDHRLAELIHGWPPAWRPIMSTLSFLGEPMVVLAIGFAGFISALQHHQGMVERAFIYAAIAYGLNTALKLVLRRRRPHNLDVRTLGIRSYSFPSGHAFGTVIFYGLIAYLDFNYLTAPWNSVIAGVLSVLIALIGLSRVYLEAHYPSDVVAGWLLGGLSLAIIITLAFY